MEGLLISIGIMDKVLQDWRGLLFVKHVAIELYEPGNKWFSFHEYAAMLQFKTMLYDCGVALGNNLLAIPDLCRHVPEYTVSFSTF